MPDPLVLEKVRRLLDLTRTDLYTRYIAVTGLASSAAVYAYLAGKGPALEPPEHDKVVLVLNECLLERGMLDRLPFLEP